MVLMFPGHTQVSLAEKGFVKVEWCPSYWDGWLCWPSAPPETLVHQPCPAYFKGVIHQGKEPANLFTLATKRPLPSTRVLCQSVMRSVFR